MENKFSVLGAKLWVMTLAVVAFLVILVANFRFQENVLKKELIEHATITVGKKNVCICSLCQKKGLAYCIHCGSPMNWDKSSRHFICPNCKTVGLPRCPDCKVLMFGLNIGKKVQRRLVTASPIPVY
ncbi:MAG: hypothetical protein OEY92_03895 [Elusimicrobiota bacterium]|nr:hypothetical protein [Elusimicrobiota bacterium]